MTKYKFISSAFISALFIALISCNEGKKQGSEAKETEVLPEDIVEMRDDQIKLAHIETGTIETRSLSGTLKVNGSIIGEGNVHGPASSTPNALARFTDTSGKTITDSVVILDNAGNMTGVNNLTATLVYADLQGTASAAAFGIPLAIIPADIDLTIALYIDVCIAVAIGSVKSCPKLTGASVFNH